MHVSANAFSCASIIQTEEVGVAFGNPLKESLSSRANNPSNTNNSIHSLRRFHYNFTAQEP
jgi:hypothetical protein